MLSASTVVCGQGAGYETDPATGIVYRKVIRTVERPVVETTVQQRQQTVYRPQTVTEVKPETRTVYTPVVEYKWQPRLHGRWNPFQRPTVAYHHVPTTHWEPRSEVVQRTNTRTEWVAENRTIEEPRRVVRMTREQKVDYEPVGKVGTPQAGPTATSSIASRLRPLDSGTPIQPLNSGTQIAASTVGRMTSDPPRRTIGQGGLRATDLYPSGPSIRGQALPPNTGGVGIAMPTLPFLR
jgi:hypothetical protein